MKKIILSILVLIAVAYAFLHEKPKPVVIVEDKPAAVKPPPGAMHEYVGIIPKVNKDINNSLKQGTDNIKNAEEETK